MIFQTAVGGYQRESLDSPQQGTSGADSKKTLLQCEEIEPGNNLC